VTWVIDIKTNRSSRLRIINIWDCEELFCDIREFELCLCVCSKCARCILSIEFHQLSDQDAFKLAFRAALDCIPSRLNGLAVSQRFIALSTLTYHQWSHPTLMALMKGEVVDEQTGMSLCYFIYLMLSGIQLVDLVLAVKILCGVSNGWAVSQKKLKFICCCRFTLAQQVFKMFSYLHVCQW